MTDVPDIHYVRAPDGTTLAYRVSGEGPHDLLCPSGGFSVDLLWDDPGFQRLNRRLGGFTRTAWMELRGTGASEGERRDLIVEDVYNADRIAIQDAVGFRRPAVVGWSSGAMSAIEFAVAHPDRLSALILIDACAHYVRESDYPWGIPRRSLDRFAASLRETWGSGEDLSVTVPGRAADDRFRAWYARTRRVGIGPDMLVESFKWSLEQDVRHLLPSISVPTLVLHREGDRFIRPGAGRYLAEHIEGARFVLLPGDEHLYFAGDTDALVDEIEEFLTGARSGGEADVVMAAVLFTDIVGSTEQQAQLGPREWSRVTETHDALIREALARHRGHEVKTTGDGFLATFDSAGRALRSATQIVTGAKGIGLEIRAGVHSGEVQVRGDDIAGMSVNIAKRVCDLANGGEVLVTETVRLPMVGSGIEFADRGEHELRGVPGMWRLYAVAS